MFTQPLIHSTSDALADNLYDVAIIGGGPAGLSAALYASRAGLQTIVLDKSPGAGALALPYKIENYPGILQVMTGKDLLSVFRQQAENFGAKILVPKLFKRKSFLGYCLWVKRFQVGISRVPA